MQQLQISPQCDVSLEFACSQLKFSWLPRTKFIVVIVTRRRETLHGSHFTEEVLGTQMKEKAIFADKGESPNPACLVYMNPDHRVKNCSIFAKKLLEEHWKLTVQLVLCRIWLGLHGKRPCRIRENCEIDGCQLRNHPLPLIHSNQESSDCWKKPVQN